MSVELRSVVVVVGRREVWVEAWGRDGRVEAGRREVWVEGLLVRERRRAGWERWIDWWSKMKWNSQDLGESRE